MEAQAKPAEEQKKQTLNQKYDRIKVLGEGAYGTAHLVKHKNDPDLLAVIK